MRNHILILFISFFVAPHLNCSNGLTGNRDVQNNYIVQSAILDDNLYYSYSDGTIKIIDLINNEYLGLVNTGKKTFGIYDHGFDFNDDSTVLITSEYLKYDTKKFSQISSAKEFNLGGKVKFFNENTLLFFKDFELKWFDINFSNYDSIQIDAGFNDFDFLTNGYYYINSENILKIKKFNKQELNVSVDDKFNRTFSNNNYIVIEYANKSIVYNDNGEKIFETKNNSYTNLLIHGGDYYYCYTDNFKDYLVSGDIINGKEEKVQVPNNMTSEFSPQLMEIYGSELVYLNGSNTEIEKYNFDSKVISGITNLKGTLVFYEQVNFKNSNIKSIVGLDLVDSIQIKFFDEKQHLINSIKLKSQLDEVFFPIYPFEIVDETFLIPFHNNNKIQILELNMVKGFKKTWGEFNRAVTSIYVDKHKEKIFVSDFDRYAHIYNFDDKTLIESIEKKRYDIYDFINVVGVIYIVGEHLNNIYLEQLHDIETIYTSYDADRRFYTPYGVSKNGKYMIGVENSEILIFDLEEIKLHKKNQVNKELVITSAILSDDAEFAFLGTKNSGLYFLNSNKLSFISESERYLPKFIENDSQNYSTINYLSSDEFDKLDVCTDDLIYFQVDIEPLKTSVTEQKELTNLSVYPNPAQTEVSITYEKGLESIEVIDIDGRSMMSLNGLNLAYEKSINVDALSTGTYFIRINDKIYKRFVKE